MADTPGNVVDAFLSHVSLERGLARNTVSAYSRDLAHFLDYLDSEAVADVQELRRQHVTDFLCVLEEKGLSAKYLLMNLLLII